MSCPFLDNFQNLNWLSFPNSSSRTVEMTRQTLDKLKKNYILKKGKQCVRVWGAGPAGCRACPHTGSLL